MKHYMLGLFDDEEVLLDAVDKVKAQGLKIHDCVTPFAAHGLDHKLGLRESKLHIGGFWVGAAACATALGFMTWVFVETGLLLSVVNHTFLFLLSFPSPSSLPC